jgi:hypothetical protein
VQVLRVLAIVAGPHRRIPACVAQLAERSTPARALQQAPFCGRIQRRRPGDRRGLGLGELTGVERFLRFGQLLELAGRAQAALRCAHAGTGRLGQPVRRRTMSVLLPVHGILDPAGRSGPDRDRQPLTARGQIHQLLGAGHVQTAGLERRRSTRQRVLGNTNLVEHTRHAHTSPPRERSGK